jgi:hypothetical protein
MDVFFVSTLLEVPSGLRFIKLSTYANQGCPLQTGDSRKCAGNPSSGYHAWMLSKACPPLSPPALQRAEHRH